MVTSVRCFCLVSLVFVFLYLCCKKGEQVRNYQVFIPHVTPKDVWEVVSDFSNIAILNERIVRWELVDESATGETWQYDVISYESMIGEMIFGLNENHGRITVIPATATANSHYAIKEFYNTLSFRDLLQIENWSEMKFKEQMENGINGTLFEQEVGMRCLLVFSILCVIETDMNREAFYKNLLQHFAKKKATR